MAGNLMKGCTGHYKSGTFGNVPVMQDGTGTPKTSPLTGTGAAIELKVPPSAIRFNVRALVAVATLLIKNDGSGGGSGAGTITLPIGTLMSFDCAGMNDAAGVYPTAFSINQAAGAGQVCDFWFDCLNPNGA
jgi:hypothetical protein